MYQICLVERSVVRKAIVPGGGGDTTGNSGGGCAPGSPNSDPISDQNCNFPYKFRPGL